MGSKSNRAQEAMSDIDESETALMAMQLASASVLPMVLKAVIELGVLDIIAGEPLFPAEIAANLPECSNPAAAAMLDRMLRLLACHSVVQCSLRGGEEERLYGLTPVSKMLRKNEDGVSFAHLCLISQDKVLLESWQHLKDAVLEGGVPFNKTYGMSIYEYCKSDPRFNNIFNRTMSNNSTIIMKKLVEIYKGFEGLNTLVDVGGGSGALLSMIVAKYPSIRAINFDLPHVIDNAPTYPGVEHVSGDMFVSVPRGDAIMMKLILHNWSDEQCVKILKKCCDAVAENGKVIVIESILPAKPETSLVAKRIVCVDLIMLAHIPSGKERTSKEYEALALASGFKGFRVACNDFYTHVLEFTKN